jgi:uncharacterized surface protein with fasciclin (FAS1) repeats
MRRTLLTLAAGLASTGLLAASALPAGAAHEPPPSIVGIALGSGDPGSYDTNGDDFDILRDAVIAAGLAGALSGGEWTVFAPNDRAFTRLVTEAGEAETFAAVADVAGDLLDDILLHHVVAGETLSRTEVIRSRSIDVASSLGPIPVRGVNLRDGDPDLIDPKLIPSASDIAASNGVVHTIDRVLLPIDVDL